MSSAQCHRPVEKTSCHQGQGHHESSLTQKVSGMASSIFKGHGSHQTHSQTTTQCHSKTETHYTNPGVGKSQTNYCHNQATQGHLPHHTMSHSGQNHCMTSHTNGNHCMTSHTNSHLPHHTMSSSGQNQCMTSHTNGNHCMTSHTNGHHASGNATACQQGKTKRRGATKKRSGFLQKIKDGISGDSSSSSDSESDDEKCGAKKASD
ncbi:hypothetical protein CCACVL1_13474 [Corchorus capsularis]|uniref:Uncharacterized protein n=1 Tax=Corchorus capsularis TaxID=210143 RepID=A0A1R3IAV7_COCAP|nr:hypothetical protein CCACVL1_13474 [Corchorus capsularis]